MSAEDQETNHFMKGLDLSKIFYEEIVKPILESHFPNLTYSAALLGSGSDVLGFDTVQSMDHGWGPRLMLFLTESDYETLLNRIDQTLRHELPYEILGFPTNFDYHKDGSTVMRAVEKGPVNHDIKINTVSRFFRQYLNYEPKEELCALDWLIFPEHRLRSIRSGRVFYDSLGELEPTITRLHYYPNDVWLYLLSNQWRRISQEEAFMGRCGQVGDEVGSRLIAARQIRDIMNLCFLIEREYAPYIKWLGTAFSQLDCSRDLTPIFTRVLDACPWQERQEHLTSAYEFVAQMNNDLGITSPLNTRASQFHKRPFLVIRANDFAEAIWAEIRSEEVKKLPKFLGKVDQFIDSTDILTSSNRLNELKSMYN